MGGYKMLLRKMVNARNYFLFVIWIACLISLATAEVQTLGTFKQNECIGLVQTCSNCTSVNISSVTYPNSSIAISNKIMSSTNNIYYNYSFCNTSSLGNYIVSGYANVDGSRTVWAYDFIVTSTGEDLQLSQGIIILGQLGIIALFLIIGFSISQEKWKVRMFFFIMALVMGVLTLNTIRIVATASLGLSSMGQTGLIVGLVVLLFMISYVFIYYTIEVFQYFKKKKEMRWETGSDPM
jgi:hypothetical protein